MMVDSDAQKKYVHLSFVGKAALTLSHGNAAPERGFSVNNALVTSRSHFELLTVSLWGRQRYVGPAADAD